GGATPPGAKRRGAASEVFMGQDTGCPMTTVAVMQPYFVPYAGYFRLFTAADIFVAFDCVQFPRRGWVHRNRLALTPGNSDWLTLPIQKSDRDTRIDELVFAPDARARLA